MGTIVKEFREGKIISFQKALEKFQGKSRIGFGIQKNQYYINLKSIKTVFNVKIP